MLSTSTTSPTPARAEESTDIVIQFTQRISPIDRCITNSSASFKFITPCVTTSIAAFHSLFTAKAQRNESLRCFCHGFTKVGAVLVRVTGYGDAARGVEVTDGGVDGVEVAVDVGGELKGGRSVVVN